MEAIYLIIMGIFGIACFSIGAKIGQQTIRGETVKITEPRPIKATQSKEERMQAQAEQERLEAIMRNIENYNGSGIGQEDIPGGINWT